MAIVVPKGNSLAILVFLTAVSLSCVSITFLYDMNLQKRSIKSEQDEKTMATSIIHSKGLDKINSDGQYLPFYGYTIVSRVTGQYDYSLIEQFIRDTNVLSKYLAPLPAASYHVTIFDVFNQRDIPKKYEPVSRNVPSEHWAHVLRYLKNDLVAAKKICSEVTQKLIFHKTKLNLRNTVGESLTVGGNLTNENIVSGLRNKLFSIFSNTTRSDEKYNLTLGYLFKKIDDEDMESVNNELNTLWTLINHEYSLQAPDVYYFEIITKFTPVQDLEVN